MARADSPKPSVASHVEEKTQAHLHDLREAQAASAAEHNTTFMQAMRENYKAVLWSAAISLTLVMEGYDLALMSNFFGQPQFQRTFGRYYPEEATWQLTGAWQAGLQNGTNTGIIIGGFLNGWASSKFGYRRTLQVALVCLIGFIFISFFAVRVEMLLVGQMLCGLTFGVFATTGPAYASEVTPLALRGYLTVYVNMCWAMGQFIASGVLRGLLRVDSQWGWRGAIALQWLWPIPILVLVTLAPESPWWLAKQERYEEAERSLLRLSTRSSEQVKASLAQMVHTIQIESEIHTGTSYFDCFRGTNRRRTIICMVTFAGQQLSGATFAFTPTYFFLQAGISTTNAFTIAIASTGMAFIGTLISWFLLARFGRRILYLSGIACMTVVLLIVGICSAASASQGAMWTQVAFILIWKLLYSLTVGPICYAIISETSAIRLRPQTVVIARNTYCLTQIVAQVLNPYMLNPIEWNWKGKAGFFWAGTAGLTTIWAFFKLPETKDRTYEELDLLFAKKTSARKFEGMHIDAYADVRRGSED